MKNILFPILAAILVSTTAIADTQWSEAYGGNTIVLSGYDAENLYQVLDAPLFFKDENHITKTVLFGHNTFSFSAEVNFDGDPAQAVIHYSNGTRDPEDEIPYEITNTENEFILVAEGSAALEIYNALKYITPSTDGTKVFSSLDKKLLIVCDSPKALNQTCVLNYQKK